jgi:PAS domain-containing protein
MIYDFVMGEMRAYLAGDRPIYDVKYRIRRKDGDYSWYYDRGGIIERSTEGKPLKLTGMVLDVSEIKVLQENILQDSKIINAVIESSPVANTILDSEGNIIFANKAAEAIFDLSKKELRHRKYNSPTWSIISMDGEPISDENLPFALIKRSGKPLRDFKHYIFNGIDKKLLNITGFPAIDKDGKVFSAYFIIEVLDETIITKDL